MPAIDIDSPGGMPMAPTRQITSIGIPHGRYFPDTNCHTYPLKWNNIYLMILGYKCSPENFITQFTNLQSEACGFSIRRLLAWRILELFAKTSYELLNRFQLITRLRVKLLQLSQILVNNYVTESDELINSAFQVKYST